MIARSQQAISATFIQDQLNTFADEKLLELFFIQITCFQMKHLVRKLCIFRIKLLQIRMNLEMNQQKSVAGIWQTNENYLISKTEG
jgi:hypothetical protein